MLISNTLWGDHTQQSNDIAIMAFKEALFMKSGLIKEMIIITNKISEITESSNNDECNLVGMREGKPNNS
jgi:hypothetical protein